MPVKVVHVLSVGHEYVLLQPSSVGQPIVSVPVRPKPVGTGLVFSSASMSFALRIFLTMTVTCTAPIAMTVKIIPRVQPEGFTLPTWGCPARAAWTGSGPRDGVTGAPCPRRLA